MDDEVEDDDEVDEVVQVLSNISKQFNEIEVSNEFLKTIERRIEL